MESSCKFLLISLIGLPPDVKRILIAVEIGRFVLKGEEDLFRKYSAFEAVS